MSFQDAALLFVMLFPFGLVAVGTVALIRKRLKKKPQLKLVDPAGLKQMENLASRMGQLNAESFRDEALDEQPPLQVSAKKKSRKKRRSNRGKRK